MDPIIGVFAAIILAGIYYETRRGSDGLHRIAMALERRESDEK
tara:strand:- start:838 stop:966 length:129 start_codon:yes stop_codon:yes gene_type:complete